LGLRPLGEGSKKGKEIFNFHWLACTSFFTQGTSHSLSFWEGRPFGVLGGIEVVGNLGKLEEGLN